MPRAANNPFSPGMEPGCRPVKRPVVYGGKGLRGFWFEGKVGGKRPMLTAKLGARDSMWKWF